MEYDFKDVFFGKLNQRNQSPKSYGHQLTQFHHLVAKQKTTGKICDTFALSNYLSRPIICLAPGLAPVEFMVYLNHELSGDSRGVTVQPAANEFAVTFKLKFVTKRAFSSTTGWPREIFLVILHLGTRFELLKLIQA